MGFNPLRNHRKVGVRCYDNGGETADRYTAVLTGRYSHLTGKEFWDICMSSDPFHPQGVGMHGSSATYIDNRGYGQRGGYSHLGKKISFDQLPDKCQKLVMSTLFDLAY